MSFTLAPQRLFDGEHWLIGHVVVIADERVAQILPQSEAPLALPQRQLPEGTLAPGLIDLQVNGGGGVLLNNDPTPASVYRMTEAHRSRGTTAMTPTLISDQLEQQQAAVEAVAIARAGGNRSVLGVHVEGPFFEPMRRGTHRADAIRGLTDTDIRWLSEAAQQLPVLLTLAPEHAAAGQIQALDAAGIRVFAGHTDASYEQVQAAIAEGLRGFTHLFNAMSPLTSREPGVVGAALDSDETWVGIIADGHHVHPASARIAQRAKRRGKLMLVSDAMATVGSDHDSFELYGETIAERNGKLVNAEGALAGSAIGMIDAVRIAHRDMGLPLDECLRMASLYPAECIDQAQELGRIRPGYRADFVHFDTRFNVTHTWVAGDQLQHDTGNP